METRFLESFIAIAELGSIAAAARQLGITPAAVAQRIRALEEEIGVSLLSRAGRTVRPTQAGSAILARGRVILRDVKEIGAIAGGEVLGGELRIGAISTALTGFVPSILKCLMRTAPKVDFYIVPGTSMDLYRRVTDGELDAALLVQPHFALPKACDWQTLRNEPLIVLAPREFGDEHPHKLLRTQPFIRYDRNHWGGRLADLYLRRFSIRPRERLELDALDSIAVMVNEGLGVSLVPNWAPPWPHGITISKLRLPSSAPVRHVGLLWMRASPRLRLIRAFLACAARPGERGRQTSTRSTRGLR